MVISKIVVGDAALTGQLCPGLYLNSAYGERESSHRAVRLTSPILICITHVALCVLVFLELRLDWKSSFLQLFSVQEMQN